MVAAVAATATTDLAAQFPDLLAELTELWWDEARRNQVLPLDNRVLWALVNPKPDHRRPREQFRYFQGGAQVPEPVAVNVRNRSHALIVDIAVPDPGQTDGVLLSSSSSPSTTGRSAVLWLKPGDRSCATRSPSSRPSLPSSEAAGWTGLTGPS